MFFLLINAALLLTLILTRVSIFPVAYAAAGPAVGEQRVYGCYKGPGELFCKDVQIAVDRYGYLLISPTTKSAH